MTSTLEFRQSRHSNATGPGSLANIEVIENLSEAEPYWRGLQSNGAVSTPYQSFDFLAAWHREIGEPAGMIPFIVIGFDSGQRPLFLLPLGMHRIWPLRLLQFLGGKHANFNFGIWDRDAASALTADDLQFLLQRIAASPQCPDALALYNQPSAWLDLGNPLSLLPHRPAVDDAAQLVIDGPSDEVIKREVGATTRRRLRTKERHLHKLAGYRYSQAVKPADVDRLLDRFFELKTAHMAAQGLPDVFSQEGVQAFLRAACRQSPTGGPSVELHGLESDGELLALFGALTDGESLSVMVNTYTLSDNARHSPGLVLILYLIHACAERGIRYFDLGVGEGSYKSWFCKQPIMLFDSLLPLTSLGRLAVVGLDTAKALKREIKSSPVLLNLYRTIRRTLGS